MRVFDRLNQTASLDHPAFLRSHIHLTHSRLVSK
jgi:hypothetical protein